jgi:hypothetical protein
MQDIMMTRESLSARFVGSVSKRTQICTIIIKVSINQRKVSSVLNVKNLSNANVIYTATQSVTAKPKTLNVQIVTSCSKESGSYRDI